MRRILPVLAVTLLFAAAAGAVPPPGADDREWRALAADYQWLESLRKAQAPVPPSAPRKQQIQAMLANLQKLEPAYVVFVDKLHGYYTRTGDPRAAQVLVREKLILGDQYLVLSRYERAIELYREALVFEPSSPDAKARIATAEEHRFVSMAAFAGVKAGMSEENVRNKVGYPREDWIRQVVQNNRAYTVWIYPKADGGAAAIYFDNGVVYHTNWNAAAPQPAAQTPGK